LSKAMQAFEMVGQQGHALELEHHQGAVHLVQGIHALAQRRFAVGGGGRLAGFQRLGIGLQAATRRVQRFQQLALDPVEGEMFPACRHVRCA